MANKYLLPKAINQRTRQTVKEQDLHGGRFEIHQRALAQQQADFLAERMAKRTGDEWKGFVEEYVPTERRTQY